MKPIQLYISILVLLTFLMLASGSPLWAHHGANAIKKLFLEEAKTSLKAEDFSTVNLNNQPVKLSDYQGKVIFLNFWATWCVPCRVEMPDMKRLEKRFKNQPFIILTVNLQESPEKIRKFYQELNLSFDTLLDPEGEIFELYLAKQLPTTYLINKRGFVIARAVGPREWDSEEGVDYITHLVEEKIEN